MLADGLRADLELIAGQLFFLIADGLRADLELQVSADGCLSCLQTGVGQS